MTNRKTKILVISVAIGLLTVLILSVAANKALTVLKYNQWQRLNTYNFMESLSMTTKMVLNDTGGDVPTDMSSLVEMFVDYDSKNERIKTLNFLILHFGNSAIDAEKLIIYDPWGQPMKLIAESPQKYIFVSYGYNKKDDKGKRDDITFIFDPKAKVDYENHLRW